MRRALELHRRAAHHPRMHRATPSACFTVLAAGHQHMNCRRTRWRAERGLLLPFRAGTVCAGRRPRRTDRRSRAPRAGDRTRWGHLRVPSPPPAPAAPRPAPVTPVRPRDSRTGLARDRPNWARGLTRPHRADRPPQNLVPFSPLSAPGPRRAAVPLACHRQLFSRRLGNAHQLCRAAKASHPRRDSPPTRATACREGAVPPCGGSPYRCRHTRGTAPANGDRREGCDRRKGR